MRSMNTSDDIIYEWNTTIIRVAFTNQNETHWQKAFQKKCFPFISRNIYRNLKLMFNIVCLQNQFDMSI